MPKLLTSYQLLLAFRSILSFRFVFHFVDQRLRDMCAKSGTERDDGVKGVYISMESKVSSRNVGGDGEACSEAMLSDVAAVL